jgi:SAM-dependent methyltransferase
MNQFVIEPERPDLGGNIRGGDIHTFSPNVWRFLIERFAVRSVLDVGCGEGHAVSFFHRLGVIAAGIDGLERNVKNAVHPIALHDLLTGPFVMPVDLVWSCEVAEHILPEKVDFFLDTLANGRVVAMTHAIPGQGGYHHVNLQPSEYWIEKMESRGYVLSDSTPVGRRIAAREDDLVFFQTSGLIFIRI